MERLLLILNSFWDQFPNPQPKNFTKTLRSWSNTTLQYMICISMPEPSYRYSYTSQTSKSLLFAYRNSSTPINSPNETALGNLWRTLEGIQLLANYNESKLNSVRYHWKCQLLCANIWLLQLWRVLAHVHSLKLIDEIWTPVHFPSPSALLHSAQGCKREAEVCKMLCNGSCSSNDQ